VFIALAKAISFGVIKVTLDRAYNPLRGLYIDFGKAKTKGYVISNDNNRTRYDEVGSQNLSLGKTY
jgi:hypothetical protein